LQLQTNLEYRTRNFECRRQSAESQIHGPHNSTFLVRYSLFCRPQTTMKLAPPTSGFAYAAASLLSLIAISFSMAAERLQNLPPPQGSFTRNAQRSAEGPPIPSPH